MLGTSVLAAVLALGGCAGSSLTSWMESDPKSEETKTAAQLFAEGDTLLEERSFSTAAERFEEVDKQYPYSPEARRAIVMNAYANYRARKLPEAVSSARRYLTLHPGTKEAPLAQHIIASSYFERINDPQRDQSDTKQAITELEVLIRRYPDSSYAAQARKRLKIAKDLIAAQDMTVGRYYMKRGEFLAAINRFRTVVTDHQETAHVEEALSRLTESYMAVGLTSEAQTAAAVLGHNFPESQWYKDAYTLLQTDGLEPREDTGSWISRQWQRTVKSVQEASPI